MSSAEGCGHQLFQFVFYRHTQPIQLFICKKKNPSLLEKQLRHWRLYYPGGAVSLLAWKAPANSSQTNDRNVTCWRMCTFLVQNTGQVGLTAVSPDSFIALGVVFFFCDQFLPPYKCPHQYKSGPSTCQNSMHYFLCTLTTVIIRLQHLDNNAKEL